MLETRLPARQKLVNICLVARVEQQQVARRVEDAVKCDGQLDRTQVGSEVPAGLRNGIDEEVANLRRQGHTLGARKRLHVAGSMDVVEDHGGREGAPHLCAARK